MRACRSRSPLLLPVAAARVPARLPLSLAICSFLVGLCWTNLRGLTSRCSPLPPPLRRCAHSFSKGVYSFDSGPSLWSGCAAPSYNPLRQVFDAVGESPEWVQYDGWQMYTQSGDFFARAGDETAWKATLAELGDGQSTVEQWDQLIEFIRPLQKAVLAVPPLA